MVLDTSGILCVLLAEPEAKTFAEAIVTARHRTLSAATWVETAIVVTAKRGTRGRAEFDKLLAAADAEVVAVDAAQAELAFGAWLKYGKGRHDAGLDFGDCFAYALAKQRGEPLLCKGDDFARTDIVLAPAR